MKGQQSNHKKKKIGAILLPLLFLLVAGGGFSLYGFVFRKPNVEPTISYQIERKSISAVGQQDNETQIKVEYSHVEGKQITGEEHIDQDGYTGDQLLTLDGLQQNSSPVLKDEKNLVLSFQTSLPTTEFKSFKFGLVASVGSQKFRSPDINCYLQQRNIAEFSQKSLGDFETQPTDVEIIANFFSDNNITYDDDGDCSSGDEVVQYLIITWNASGAVIQVKEGNPLFIGQTQLIFDYPKGTDINTIITNKDCGEFIEIPNALDIQLRIQQNNTPPTGGGTVFWAQVVISTPASDNAGIGAYGSDYAGRCQVTYNVTSLG